MPASAYVQGAQKGMRQTNHALEHSMHCCLSWLVQPDLVLFTNAKYPSVLAKQQTSWSLT
jgi:hypothetical protein